MEDQEQLKEPTEGESANAQATILDLNEVRHEGTLTLHIEDKRKINEQTRFALTDTHLWVFRRNHYTPLIELWDILAVGIPPDSLKREAALDQGDETPAIDGLSFEGPRPFCVQVWIKGTPMGRLVMTLLARKSMVHLITGNYKNLKEQRRSFKA